MCILKNTKYYVVPVYVGTYLNYAPVKKTHIQNQYHVHKIHNHMYSNDVSHYAYTYTSFIGVQNKIYPHTNHCYNSFCTSNIWI